MVNKEFRPDVIWFNNFIITVLCVFAVILVRFEALNIFFAFGLFGVFLLVAVLSYMIGLQRGLLLSVGVTFCYGSYLIYSVIISKEMTTVDPLDVAWLFLIPLISVLAAKLGECISSNESLAKDVEAIAELVTLDGDTGFYNNQGFFKKLDEEFWRAKRYNEAFTLLLLQIANFDEIQLAYGNVGASRILIAVAKNIDLQMRGTDVKGLLIDNILGILMPGTNVSELEKLVTLDGSTGFYNQQGFFKQLEEEVGRVKRYGTSFSLLLFQISNLQQLQSIYKKQDIMFIKKTVAEIVASKLRFTDCKGILDDGSIGVILPQTESGGLDIVVSKIDTAVGLIPVKLSSAKRMVRVRTSLGYATIENTDTDYKMLYLRAKEDLVNGG